MNRNLIFCRGACIAHRRRSWPALVRAGARGIGSALRRARRGASPLAASLLVALAAQAAAATAAPAGDAARGAGLFRACAACHSTLTGDHRTGPSLAAIHGREAASIAEFRRYSPALRASGLVWDDATLDAWLRDPAALVPGNLMAFEGVRDDQARRDLVAYLRALAEGRASDGAPGMPALPDLKQLPAVQHVREIRHCGDTYRVTLGDGETYPFWDFNLRFKTDASARGPAPGQPVIVGAGMRGDRAQIVFAEPAEISSFIRSACE